MIKTTKSTRIALKLVLCLLVIAISIIFSYKNAYITRNDYYDIQYKSSNRLSECMKKVREYKLEVGAKLSDYEYFDTGMIGEEYNFITTALGDLAAKRTTASPDMAALIVKMYENLGLKKGDRIGIGLSGSFPTMNMAVIIAAEEMGLEPIIISSVGASTYGANNPEISFPEILHRLNNDKFISNDSIFITLGGD